MIRLALAWLVSPAQAAPTFVSDDPLAARLATQAWHAAAECAGFEAAAADRVTVELGDPGGGFAGKAHTAGDTVWRTRDATGKVISTRTEPGEGLQRIVLEKVTSRIVAHEVAHAWSSSGPPALVEGGADLLAACIARVRPGVFDPPSHGNLDGLEDLRTWENGDDGTATRNPGYSASYLLFRVVATVIPERSLWRRKWSWEDFDALLEDEAGPLGAAVVAMLRAGAEAQARGLADADGDGLLGVQETTLGTDPSRWDTDGDGWWDGAPDALRARAIPTPPAHAVCSGKRTGARPTRVTVTGGGPGGAEVPDLVFAKEQAEGGALVPRHTSVLVESPTGGWAAVAGRGLVPDDRCWSNGRQSVVATAEKRASLAPFVEALAAADARAEALLGPWEDPVVLWLGEWPTPSHAGFPSTVRFVHVPERLELAAAAAFVVAEQRLQTESAPGEPALDVALAREIGAPDLTYDENPARIAAWTSTVDACPGRWRDLVRGRCAPPPDSVDVRADEVAERLDPPAPDHPGALDLGADQLPVCTGQAAGPSGANVVVLGGAAGKTWPVPTLLADGAFQKPGPIAAGGSLMLRASTADPAWGRVDGVGLVPDRRCWSDGRWTVAAAYGQEEVLGPFVAALARADAAADGLLDPPEHRLLVMLGDQRKQYTTIPRGWLEAGNVEYAAAYAVASQRLQAAPVTRDTPGDVGMYEALARVLLPSLPAEYLAVMGAEDVTPWTAAVKACPGGWRAFARGTCPLEGRK